MNDCRYPSRGKSVKDDWRSILPKTKATVYDRQVRDLESSYVMWSVSLDQAIELRHIDQPGKSLETVGMTSGFCKLLSRMLVGLLRALSEHAKHYGTVPNAVPLDPENFQGQIGRRSARMNNLMNHILLSERQQFLHKVNTLEEIVEDLDKDYRQTADDLAVGVAKNAARMWHELDHHHYDLNTCLREAIVVFKSFLVALPVNQVGVFQNTIWLYSRLPKTVPPSSIPALAHRRTAVIASE